MPRPKRHPNESLMPPEALASAAHAAIDTARELWRPYLSLVGGPIAKTGNGDGNGDDDDDHQPARALPDPFQLVATSAAAMSSWFDLMAINAAWLSNMARVMRGQRPE